MRLRFGKQLVAMAATGLLYLAGLVLVAPTQALIAPNSAPVAIGGVAYATAEPLSRDEICKDYKYNPGQLDACEAGFSAGTLGEPRADACTRFGGAQQTACYAGFDGYVNEGRGPPEDGAGDLGVSDTGDPTQCGGGSFSWALCPFMQGIHDAVTFVEVNIIQPFLDTPSLEFEGPMYEIWQVMRGLANVMFVLVFVFLIVANTTSINIKTYHVRRMLPRLVAAAIMVQASFLITALVIDVTNVLGGGIFELIDGLIPEYADNISGGEAAASATLGLAALIGGVLGVAALVNSGAILLVLIGALVGIVLTFLTLVLRQIILTLLIITAPLAFAAWVLPNTEEFFEDWWELFVKLLLMYPLIMLFFAAGKLFSVAASAAAGTSVVAPIFAIIGLVAPLFMIPLAFNFAGTIFKSSRNMMLKAAGKAHSSVADKIKESQGMKDWKGRRSSTGAVALANVSDKLDKWGKDPNATALQRLRVKTGKAELLARASVAHGDPSLAGHLHREQAIQQEMKRTAGIMDDMNTSRDDYKALAGSTGRGDANVPAKLAPYNTIAGRAAALRKLHEDKAFDETGDVANKLAAMSDRTQAEKVRSLAFQGKGGVMYVVDPAYAGGGIDGTKLLKPESGTKIKAERAAGIMTSMQALDRNFGTTLTGPPSNLTRRLGEVDSAGKLTGNLHHVEQALEAHGLAGGQSLTFTKQELKTSLSGRWAGESHAAGRRRFKELMTNANAQRRIAVLDNYALTMRASGQTAKAIEAEKMVDNLKNLRDTANTQITD